MAGVFDDALEKRYQLSPDMVLADVDGTDVFLIRNAQTGTVLRISASTLASFINAAISQAYILEALDAPYGVATLGSDSKVPAAQLPSYVDDVLEFANYAALPATGESGKIYVALDSNKTYRWSGSGYTEISQSLALGETSSTAYRGDRGKTAYDHSQATGNPHGTSKADLGLGNVDNTSDANKPVSTAQQTALNLKANKAQENWTAPTFLNSWINNGSGYNNAGFYKDEFGIVHLRGLVKSGTMQASIFTLPTGYRPAAREFFGTVSNALFGSVYIDPDGSVVPWSGSNAWFSLDGITFKAA